MINNSITINSITTNGIATNGIATNGITMKLRFCREKEKEKQLPSSIHGCPDCMS